MKPISTMFGVPAVRRHLAPCAGEGSRVRLALAGIALGVAVPAATAGLLTVGPDYQPPTNSPPARYKAAEHISTLHQFSNDMMSRSESQVLLLHKGLGKVRGLAKVGPRPFDHHLRLDFQGG